MRKARKERKKSAVKGKEERQHENQKVTAEKEEYQITLLLVGANSSFDPSPAERKQIQLSSDSNSST